MKENVLTIPYTDELLFAVNETSEEFERTARFLLALKLYELGKISSGQASKIADMRRSDFILSLGQYKVSPFQAEINEITEEANR